jgi:hypothetical protein
VTEKRVSLSGKKGEKGKKVTWNKYFKVGKHK